MEEIIHFQVPHKKHGLESDGILENLSLSREELLTCWERCDTTIWKIRFSIAGRNHNYKALCKAIHDCIRLKYGFKIKKYHVLDALEEISDNPRADYRKFIGTCPWETVALRTYVPLMEDAKAVRSLRHSIKWLKRPVHQHQNSYS